MFSTSKHPYLINSRYKFCFLLIEVECESSLSLNLKSFRVLVDYDFFKFEYTDFDG